MMTNSRSFLVVIASGVIALSLTATRALAQDSTTSFDGPPTQVDENAVPAGIGFNQPGGELSSTALEQAAIGNPTVHYHYYGAPQPKSVAPNAPDAAVAPATQPAPPQTTTPPGYAPNTYIAPITMSQNTSWHLYTGNIGGPVGRNFGNGANVGSTNFHMPNFQMRSGMSGYIPSIDNVAYGSGAFVGDWDPYAHGGTGTIQGFD